MKNVLLTTSDLSEDVLLFLQDSHSEALRSYAVIEELAQSPLFILNPVIHLDLKSGKLVFVNPAAFNAYPDILQQGRDHPLLQGIQFSIKRALDECRSITREVVVAERTYQQAIIPNISGEDPHIEIHSHDVTRLKATEDLLEPLPKSASIEA